MGNRIYGEKIAVSQEEFKAFWRKRASLYEEKGISAVICRDQNTERANRENVFDREHIVPQLGLTWNSRVIDMGCGVDRLSLDCVISDALQIYPFAIYRTKEEYFKLYEPLFQAGFSFVEEAQMPDFGNAYPDSERRFCIMKRG